MEGATVTPGSAIVAPPVSRSFDWDELVQLILEGLVIPIVGEALLVTADGQPLPEQWARRLAEALDLEPTALPEPGGLNEVVIAYLRTGGRRNRLYARLKELLDQAPPAVPAPLAQLAAIRDFKLYVSTTCDGLLVAALNQTRFGGAARTQSLVFSLHDKVDDLAGEMETLTAPLVYQLFGRQSAVGDYAVSDEDKLEFLHRLQTVAYQPRRLFDEFRRHHLLFVGCHFPDWLARFFIRTVTNQRLLGPRDTSGFVADTEAVSNGRLSLFLRGVQAEIYPPGDPVAFVAELYQRWQAHRPTTVAEPPAASREAMLPDALFLSYTHEDRDAVLRLKQALDRVGLDVWFDQSALQGGDAWEHQIKTNIRQCSLFVPVISANAVRRVEGYFRREWGWAIERAQAIADPVPFIAPVIVDETPEGAELVPELFWRKHSLRAMAGELRRDQAEQLRDQVRQIKWLRGRGG